MNLRFAAIKPLIFVRRGENYPGSSRPSDYSELSVLLTGEHLDKYKNLRATELNKGSATIRLTADEFPSRRVDDFDPFRADVFRTQAQIDEAFTFIDEAPSVFPQMTTQDQNFFRKALVNETKLFADKGFKVPDQYKDL